MMAEVKIKNKDKIYSIMVEEQESLMDALIQKGVYVSAFCGGKGRCGKCRIQVCSGIALISSEDRKFFTNEELDCGWRLSCTLYPTENMTIALRTDDDADFEVVSEHGISQLSEQTVSDKEVDEYQLAIDIGTTTLVLELLDKKNGESICAVSLVNSQRKYGADVISRIQASIEGKKGELQKSIRQDLLLGIDKMQREYSINLNKIKRIVIAGNTTMIHLLKGYDCNSLGVFPFEPVNIDTICETAEETLGSPFFAQTVIFPGISTYVGGDIVSGLYANGFAKTDDICLLIDLGTNGEMALGNRHRILTASTAAGPAFEGGNISWGMGSVAGAICSVKIDDNDVKIKTIRDEAPCGICGTGAVEIVAELIKNGFMDETGLLNDAYFDNGFGIARTKDGKDIVFTQKDIREIQLAKAAIRAGVETLLLRYGITADKVVRVYLAGGFGYRLDTQKAAIVGMLPEELCDRVEAVGNSALAGAVQYLQDKQENELKKIISVSKEITLANDADFNTFYMEAMMF